ADQGGGGQQAACEHGKPLKCQKPLPLVDVWMRHSMVWDARYSTLPSSPKAQLAVATPGSMLPRYVPSGVNTSTPPGPVANRLPFTSIFMPSGRPFFLAPHSVTS